MSWLAWCTGRSSSCAYMDRDGQWSGIRCDAPKYLAVICKFLPSGLIVGTADLRIVLKTGITYSKLLFRKQRLEHYLKVQQFKWNLNRSIVDRKGCVDANNNCQHTIESEPGACKEYPEFAWQRCPSTCGICGEKGKCLGVLTYFEIRKYLTRQFVDPISL